MEIKAYHHVLSRDFEVQHSFCLAEKLSVQLMRKASLMKQGNYGSSVKDQSIARLVSLSSEFSFFPFECGFSPYEEVSFLTTDFTLPASAGSVTVVGCRVS